MVVDGIEKMEEQKTVEFRVLEDTRTVSTSGHYTFTTTIPPEWARAHGLRVGSKIKAMFSPRSFLILIPPDLEEEAEARRESIRKLLEGEP